jgi:hypothetical protein
MLRLVRLGLLAIVMIWLGLLRVVSPESLRDRPFGIAPAS